MQSLYYAIIIKDIARELRKGKTSFAFFRKKKRKKKQFAWIKFSLVIPLRRLLISNKNQFAFSLTTFRLTAQPSTSGIAHVTYRVTILGQAFGHNQWNSFNYRRITWSNSLQMEFVVSTRKKNRIEMLKFDTEICKCNSKVIWCKIDQWGAVLHSRIIELTASVWIPSGAIHHIH